MADIREQDLALKTTIADTDWMRLVTPTGNHRMTVGQFKDLIGYTQAKSDISQLQSDVASLLVGDDKYTKLENGMSIERKIVPIVANQTWNGTVTFQNCLDIPTVLITFSEPYTTYYQGQLHTGQITNNSVVVNLSGLPGTPVEFWLNVIVVGKWK